jgi:hypothetical protein
VARQVDTHSPTSNEEQGATTMRILTIAMMLACGPAMAGVEVTPGESTNYGALLFENDETDVRIAEDLAKCSGFWNAYAELARSTHPASAEFIEGVGRGAELAAAFLAANHVDDPAPWAEGVSGAEELYWRAMILDMVATPDEIIAKRDWCAALADIQKIIITELRKGTAAMD